MVGSDALEARRRPLRQVEGLSRYRTKPRPARPRSGIVRVEGSGAAVAGAPGINWFAFGSESTIGGVALV